MAGAIQDGSRERADAALGELADYEAGHVQQMQGYYSLLVYLQTAGKRTVQVTVDEAGRLAGGGIGESG